MNKPTYKFFRQNLDFEFQTRFFWKQIAFDLFFLATIYALYQTSFAVINVFLISTFMFRQFSILHEAVHGLSHSKGKINQVIGVIAGAFCLTPFSAWKTAHLKHHYWTGNLEQDPTFSILKSFEQSSSLKKYAIDFTWRHGIPFFAALQHFNFWIFGIKNSKSFESIFSCIVPISLYVAILSQLDLTNLVISCAGVIVYFRMYEDMVFPQHVGLYSDDDIDHHPQAWEQPHVTRTWYMPSLVEKYVVLNMNYHTEHHLFPDLPWHRLDKAHKLMLQQKEDVNVVGFDWTRNQRQRPFGEVIVPAPSRKKTAA